MDLTQEAFDALEEKLRAANGEAASRRKELGTLKEQLGAFEGIDPSKYQEAMTAKQKLEDERMKAEGDFEALLESKTAELKKMLAQKDEQIASVTGLREKEQIDGTLIAALSKGDAHSPDELSVLLRDKIGLDESGPFIKDGDSAMVKDGKRVSVNDFVSEWLSDRPRYVKAGAGGSGGAGGKEKPAGKAVSRAVFDGMSPAARMAHVKDGGSIKD